MDLYVGSDVGVNKAVVWLWWEALGRCTQSHPPFQLPATETAHRDQG